MINQKALKEILSYDPETGGFIWLIAPANCMKAGDAAGTLDRGYVQIGIKGKLYRAHRLAWLITYGEWPRELDHINHIRDDNRIANLREVTRQENCKNRSPSKRNKSGVCGVCWNKASNKWLAMICVNSKNTYLGAFIDKFEAICARKSAENKHDYHTNHGR